VCTLSVPWNVVMLQCAKGQEHRTQRAIIRSFCGSRTAWSLWRWMERESQSLELSHTRTRAKMRPAFGLFFVQGGLPPSSGQGSGQTWSGFVVCAFQEVNMEIHVPRLEFGRNRTVDQREIDDRTVRWKGTDDFFEKASGVQQNLRLEEKLEKNRVGRFLTYPCGHHPGTNEL
jgi:hypothetical protein